MPSVQSYTKAKIDALLAANKGIPGRTTIATPATFPVVASGTGKQLAPWSWTFVDQETGAASTELVNFAGSQAFGFATAGWWLLSWQVNAGFTAGATALPDHLRLQFWTYYDTVQITETMPCTPAPGYIGGRTLHGCENRVNSHVFRTPGSGVAGGEVTPYLYWPGDATIKSPTGGTNPYIRALATRLG